MHERVPDKRVFTNHVVDVPRLHLKAKPVTRLKGRRVLVYTVSRLSKCQGYLSIAYLFNGRLTDRFVVMEETAQLRRSQLAARS